MLIPNKTWCSGSPLNVNFGERSQSGFNTATNINKYCNDGGMAQSASIPTGYGFHYAWGKFIKNIGFTPSNTLYAYLAMRNGANGLGIINFSNLAGEKRAVCTIAGTSFVGVADKVHISAIAWLVKELVGLSEVNADIAALVNLVPKAIAGTSDVDASLGGLSSAVCNIIGEAIVDADISSNALISSDIEGDSTFNADIIASMYITATILAEAVLTGDIDAGAFMSADIYVGAAVDPLSPTSLAAAIWNAVANEFNDAGSMGEKLNDSGSASNPWTETIEGLYTAEDVLKILFSIAVGKTTITPGSGDTATVIFRDANDTEDRVTATLDGSERVNVILDV